MLHLLSARTGFPESRTHKLNRNVRSFCSLLRILVVDKSALFLGKSRKTLNAECKIINGWFGTVGNVAPWPFIIYVFWVYLIVGQTEQCHNFEKKYIYFNKSKLFILPPKRNLQLFTCGLKWTSSLSSNSFVSLRIKYITFISDKIGLYYNNDTFIYFNISLDTQEDRISPKERSICSPFDNLI